MKGIPAFDRLKLRGKMILIYFLAVFLPIALIGGMLILRTQSMEREKLERDIFSQFQRISREMENLFESYELLVNTLGQDRNISELLAGSYDAPIDAQEIYLSVYSKYLETLYVYPDVKQLTYYSGNPTLISAPPFFVNLEEYLKGTSEEERIAGMGATGLWSGVRKLKRNTEYWNPVNRKNETGEPAIAYSKFVGSAANEYARKHLLTVTVSAEVLSHVLSTVDPLYGASLYDLNGDPVLSAAGKTENAADQPDNELVRLGEDYRIQTVLGNGWRLSFSCPVREASAGARQLLFLSAAFLAVTALLSLLLILLFTHSITRRTGALAEKMERLLGGEAEIGPAESGADEIAQIDRHFTSLAARLQEMIRQKYVLELEKTKARLDSLQAQINPHFLYNALSTISWLTLDHSRESVRRSVELLARFYRINLSRGKEIITLGQEMEGVEAYLELQQLRYAGRIQVHCQVPAELEEAAVLKLTLQPLVENCIQHGMAGEKEKLTVVISAAVKGDRLCLTVEDDGLGINNVRLQALLQSVVPEGEGNGIGCRNIDQRIKLHFGSEFGLSLWSEEGKGTRAQVEIPFCFVSDFQRDDRNFG